jgi:peptide/nickel transport system substrate-binding protein
MLAACGPAPTPQATQEVAEATPTVEQEVQITPTPSGPRRGGTLYVAITADLNFNTILARGPNVSYAQGTIFNGLLRPDKDTFEPVADLAESWETSEDGLTWTFHLRKNVKWHDGEPFTADDVKFFYDQGVFNEDLNSRIRENLVQAVQAVEVVDDYTVRFVLLAPYAALPVVLADTQLIMPKHVLEGKDLTTYDEFNIMNPVGTGPFKIEEAVPGDHYTLVANDDYFGGRPYIDSIVFKVIPDPNVRVAQLKTGEVDLTPLSTANLAAVAAEHNIVVDYLNKVQFYGIYLNNARSPVDDPKVRQAMIYGLDRGAINDALSGGTWTIATANIPSMLAFWYDSDIQPIPYDPEKAKELLAEAGWTDSDGDGILDKGGNPFKFVITADNEPMRNQIAVIAQQYYQQLGMDAELEVMEWASLVSDRYFSNNYDALSIYQTAGPDPSILSETFVTDTPGNRWNYSNAEFDQLVAEGRTELDRDRRQEIFYRTQEILAVEDPPMVFLFYPKEIRACSQDLQGQPTGLDYGYSWRWVSDWWLDR